MTPQEIDHRLQRRLWIVALALMALALAFVVYSTYSTGQHVDRNFDTLKTILASQNRTLYANRRVILGNSVLTRALTDFSVASRARDLTLCRAVVVKIRLETHTLLADPSTSADLRDEANRALAFANRVRC